MHINAQLLTRFSNLDPYAVKMAESVATNIDYYKLIRAQENQKSNKTTASKSKIIIILNIFIVVFFKNKNAYLYT